MDGRELLLRLEECWLQVLDERRGNLFSLRYFCILGYMWIKTQENKVERTNIRTNGFKFTVKLEVKNLR